MQGVRPTVRGGLVAMAMAVAACGPMDDVGIASDVERELDRGRQFAAAVVESAESAPTPEEALAVGYLERLRLGLGSPFRLIEYSLQDPRLMKDDRERIAWALLSRTIDGHSHHVDPRVLADGDVERATRHLSLIEGAIRGSADPDGGVLAVRLAYAMAAAESSVSDPFRDRVARVAALIRDRMHSQADARRLLRAAGKDTDPLALLSVWRVERAFHVERPPSLSSTAAVERDAVALTPHLLESIRELGRRPRAGPVRMVPEPRERPLLSLEAAHLLALESGIYNAPVQTPVTVAVRTYGRVAEASNGTTGPAARFFENSVNEERLAAEHALLLHRSAGPMASAPRLALLEAAVGLRAYAQERPWFPGFDGPVQRDLEDRFGLASVRFGGDVPAHWRPYYRRMLESALSDLRRVLPSLDVRGLNVEFAPREGSPGTLAVHDPRSRTIHIPVMTGAGTIAHEVAHDMDWQTALRRYRVRGDYGTDRAVRLSDERLARVLRGLAPASLSDSPLHTHATRPAEVFARSMDWFVAVALARDGRRNGYLSSVQDDVLTGYGTVTPPDVTGAAGEALVALLDEVAPVYPETRRWFLGSFGRLRAPTAYDLARRVVEAPLTPAAPDVGQEPGPAVLSTAMSRIDALEDVRDSVLAMVDGACRAVAYDNGATSARRRLVQLATRARARGVAAEAAAALVGVDGREWVEARLEGRSRDPAPAEPVVAMLQGLVDRVEALDRGRQPFPPLEPATPASACGSRPFLAD